MEGHRQGLRIRQGQLRRAREPEDIRSAAPESHEAVESRPSSTPTRSAPQYFEKPYFLVPGKKAEKGYVLLRETLAETGKIGIARVVIRTREYLSRGDAAGRCAAADAAALPAGTGRRRRIQHSRGRARRVPHRAKGWNSDGRAADRIDGRRLEADDYQDEFRERLHKVIEKRMKSKGVVSPDTDEEPAGERGDQRGRLHVAAAAEHRTDKRTPAKKAVAEVVDDPPARKA